MAKRNGTILLIAGAGAFALMAGKKKRRRSNSANVSPIPPPQNDTISRPPSDSKGEPEPLPSSQDRLIKNVDLDGKAQLGMLYQIKLGDTPFTVASEALFGTRAPVTDPVMRRAVLDLIVRMDCGPWNQALYGVPLEELLSGHVSIDNYFTQRGISFNPIYPNNYQRITNGLKPTFGHGTHFALIWIPMINLDQFDLDGIVTTEGMNHQDTEYGLGGSMIDPPPEILSLGFANIASTEVGCELPEGDFRRPLIAD